MDQINTPKLISVICPVFNEEKTIPIFFERITKVFELLKNKYDFELLFTNNCSTDQSLELIKSYHNKDPRIKVITLSRNFGYQSSVLSGLSHVQGDAIFIIDVDCEDPPELLPKFIKKWEEGHDIVYGVRRKRQESKFIQLMRKIFYRLNKLISDHEVILDMAEFGLFTSYVRDLILSNQNTFPFIRSEIAYIGLNRASIVYDREKRVAGKSNYTFLQMFPFAVAGLLTSSTFLLRLPLYIFPFLIIFNLLLILAPWISDKNAIFIILTIGSVYISFFIAVACLYIARIYHNNVRRPLFIIDWKNSILK
jgi:dolichol-phosphate mannosyltransferase|tara:strand:- start:1716 stop:2642 length:927 start_codon:yes stop_codon:yes gene_type:complete